MTVIVMTVFNYKSTSQSDISTIVSISSQAMQFQILSSGIAYIQVFGLQHAPIAECKAEFPLIIFSHGIGGNRIAYSAIICSLVKQVSQALKTCRRLYTMLCE